MSHRARQRGGFTLVELSIAIVIVGVLASLGLVLGGRLIREARVSSERQFLTSLRIGVDSFQQDFGFLPPLVVDGPPTTNNPGPLTATNPRQPVVRNDDFLRSDAFPNEPRWSAHSVPYYLMGLLDISDGSSGAGKPIDGVVGPGFTQPQRDGSFLQRGPSYQAYVDPTRGQNRVYRDPAAPERIVIRDRWGYPVRFYRWLPRYSTAGATQGQVDQYMVPRAVGDPNTDLNLRTATYAIVSTGPDGETDERRPLPTAGRVDGRVDAATLSDAVKDDIVEVGR